MITSKHDAATVAATIGETMARIEIVADRRRVHAAAFRAGVLAEVATPGVRVQDVARRHGLSPSLIYRWRRSGVEATPSGGAVRLYPVRIAEALDATQPAPQSSRAPAPPRVGLIEIELVDGLRVRVEESISVATLRRVMTVLRG